jgi:putrescine aminotransferase
VIRAFGWGVLGFAPPLCCTADEIDLTLDQTLDNPEIRAALGKT